MLKVYVLVVFYLEFFSGVRVVEVWLNEEENMFEVINILFFMILWKWKNILYFFCFKFDIGYFFLIFWFGFVYFDDVRLLESKFFFFFLIILM